MNLLYDTFPTAFGVFSIAVNKAGELVGAAFGAKRDLARRISGTLQTRDAARLAGIRDQLVAYFAGRRRNFDLPVSPDGTAFQKDVWKALRDIPFGQTRTYGQIAAQLGRPGAARAVGRANATNPICVIIPCHRVIGADGSLTGFAFGEDLKRRLLEHEGARLRRES